MAKLGLRRLPLGSTNKLSDKVGMKLLLLLSLLSSPHLLHAASVWDTAVADPVAAQLARPTKAQYEWQEQELAMFVQLDPATIQQREYDDGSTPLKDIRFEKLDVNEWCQAAKSFGAKEIVFMLAHSGGFCMWPSQTTQYHIGNTAYRGGGGDVVKEFAAACRRHGLNAGFYFWLPHPRKAAEDTSTISYRKLDKVETWEDSNRLLERRFDEIMDRLGSDLVTEIWIDQPIKAAIGKRIAERAPRAVIAAVGSRDPLPTIRWPGNERGVVAYPCWSTLDRARIAATEAPNQVEADKRQIQGAENPNGDYWAPHEADVPLHEHFWHMRPEALKHRRSLETLMDCYEKSVGRNSFLILNCAPQADGSVHPDDMKRYEEFGTEIRRRFGNPLGKIEQVATKDAVLNLGSAKTVGYVDLWEDYRYGHRIRAFVIEGFDGKGWVKLFEGTAVGRRMLARCNPTEVSQVRVRVTESVGTPLIRRLQVHAPAQAR